MRRFHLMVMVLLAVCFFNSATARSTPRFVDFGEGALWDRTTGLYWLQNADCYGAQAYNNATPLPPLLSSGQYGLTDGSVAGQWRMPSIEELRSLTAAPDNYRTPSLTAAGFQNVGGVDGATDYWSSSQYEKEGVLRSYLLDPKHGVNASCTTFGPYSSYNIWPVRDLAAGILAVSPIGKYYGAVAVPNTSEPQLFTISNVGNTDVSISDISMAEDDSTMFTVDKGDGSGGTCGDTPTLAPNGSCTVSAAFVPQKKGARETKLRITSNAYNAPTTDIALSGNLHEPNVSWWQADNNANDSVGTNNGTTNAMIDAFAPGMDGQAFNFDGSSAQWVSVPHSSSLDIHGSQTIAFWTKLNELPPSDQLYFLVSKLTDGLENKWVAVDSSGKVTYFLYGTTADSGVQSATPIAVGEWTHVAVTYNGDTQKIYINGVLDASTPSNGDVGDGDSLLYLGYSPQWAQVGNEAHFNGLLDDVVWDNRAMPTPQITMFMQIPPDPFSFTAKADMPLSMGIVSNHITVTGINDSTLMEIFGGEYSVSTDGGLNWSDWSNARVLVSLNDQVKVRVVSSENYSTIKRATLEIGGVSGVFKVTTATLGDPNANGLVSWWQAEGTVNDSVSGNNGENRVSVVVPQSSTASAVCPIGGTISSYKSVYGAGSNWVDCGECTEGARYCVVDFYANLCADPIPGVAKTGKLDIFYDTAFAPGKIGQAFDFGDNNIKLITVPNSPSLDVNESLTVSFWVKLKSLPPANRRFSIVYKLQNPIEFKHIFIQDDGKVEFSLHGLTGWGVRSNKPLATDVWNHVTVTYNGSDMKIYINGLLDASKPATGDVADGTGTLYLGNQNFSGSDVSGLFDGLLDDVKWFNQTLTAEEIFRMVNGNEVPVDTDNDGIEDDWERTHFGDLTTADAVTDFDGDGYTDLQEYENNEAGIVDPDGIAFDPKETNTPQGGAAGNDITPVLMLLLD